MTWFTKLAALNAFLEATYQPGYRLSTMLNAKGCTPEHIAILRAQHLDALVDAYLTSVESQLAACYDGDRKYLVLERRFGLDGEQPATLAAIGAQLGISRENVRRIACDALHFSRYSRNRHGCERALYQAAQELLLRELPSLLLKPVSESLGSCDDPEVLDFSSQREYYTGTALPGPLQAAILVVLKAMDDDITDRWLTYLLAGSQRPLVRAVVAYFHLETTHGLFAAMDPLQLKVQVRLTRRMLRASRDRELHAEQQKVSKIPVPEPSLIETQELLRAIEVRIKGPLTHSLLTHILYGSKGPRVNALVTNSMPPEYGTLRTLGFQRVKQLVSQAR